MMTKTLTLGFSALLLVAAMAFTARGQFGSTGGFTPPQETLPSITDDVSASTTTFTSRYFYRRPTSEFVMYREAYLNDSTPLANNNIERLDWYGNDSAGNKDLFARIAVLQEWVTTTDEDAAITFSIKDNGSTVQYLRIDATDGTEAVVASKLIQANAGLKHQTGVSIPATCVQGSMYHDTNSDDCANTGGGDGALCICKTTNTWALVQNM